MSLKSQLETALKDAMRANDDVKRRTLRMALSNIKMAEIEKGSALDDPAIELILLKELKSRREAIDEAQKATRQDLKDASLAEMAVLESFLPKPLTDDELKEVVNSVMLELNASSPADMGRIIKAVKERVQTRAAGDRISQTVRALLQK